jgi:hypothetical protein
MRQPLLKEEMPKDGKKQMFIFVSGVEILVFSVFLAKNTPNGQVNHPGQRPNLPLQMQIKR